MVASVYVLWCRLSESVDGGACAEQIASVTEGLKSCAYSLWCEMYSIPSHAVSPTAK